MSRTVDLPIFEIHCASSLDQMGQAPSRILLRQSSDFSLETLPPQPWRPQGHSGSAPQTARLAAGAARAPGPPVAQATRRALARPGTVKLFFLVARAKPNAHGFFSPRSV